MNETTTGPLYNLWSLFYDKTFGALVVNRQARAVEQVRLKAGDRVLDLGVGTGMMLPRYHKGVTVVGMDLSRGMLNKAAQRCQREGLKHCQLVQSDAMLPPFAPQSFDQIMISHVITVVSDPAKLLNWAGKLLKPGGRIVMLNHFQSTHRLMAMLETALNPLFVKIGWKSDLAMEDVLRGSGMEVEYCFKMKYIDLWRIVLLKPQPSAKSTAQNASMTARSLAAPRLPAQVADQALEPLDSHIASSPNPSSIASLALAGGVSK